MTVDVEIVSFEVARRDRVGVGISQSLPDSVEIVTGKLDLDFVHVPPAPRPEGDHESKRRAISEARLPSMRPR